MSKLKVLYAASEADPLYCNRRAWRGCRVIGQGLGRKKYEDKIDIRIILPLYQGIGDRTGFEFVGKTSVPLAWRQQYCGVYKKVENKVTYYFIDNEY